MRSDFLNTFDRCIAATLKWICIVCMVGLVFLVGAGVFVRFVPVSSMGWADEIIELAFAWLVFFGAALLWRNRTHFRVNILEQFVAGTRFAGPLALVVNVICLLFFLILAYKGAELTFAAVDTSPILVLPKSIWYAVIPVSAIIMIAYTVRDIWLLVSRGLVEAVDGGPDAASCEPGMGC